MSVRRIIDNGAAIFREMIWPVVGPIVAGTDDLILDVTEDRTAKWAKLLDRNGIDAMITRVGVDGAPVQKMKVASRIRYIDGRKGNYWDHTVRISSNGKRSELSKWSAAFAHNDDLCPDLVSTAYIENHAVMRACIVRAGELLRFIQENRDECQYRRNGDDGNPFMCVKWRDLLDAGIRQWIWPSSSALAIDEAARWAQACMVVKHEAQTSTIQQLDFFGVGAK